MLAFLGFVVGVLLVGGVLFLGASLLLGRGETRPPAELDQSPVELPDDRPVTGDDVRALRISVAVRGYRMTEVDWLLEQFALALDRRDDELAVLRAQLRDREEATTDDGSAESPDGGDQAPSETGDGDREDRHA
jgi:DivIVA domain-containing protein